MSRFPAVFRGFSPFGASAREGDWTTVSRSKERDEMSPMTIAGDGQPDAVEGPASGCDERAALGHQLEGFRAYLLTVAGREMNPALRAKCGASDLVQQTLFEAVRDREACRGLTPQQV